MNAPLELSPAAAGDLISNNPFRAYLAELAGGSIHAQRSTLGVVVRLFFGFAGELGAYPWHELRFGTLCLLRTWLTDRYAPNTANRALGAVRGILRHCYRLELLSERDFRQAVGVKSVRGSRPPAGRYLPPEELRRLFAALEAEQGAELGARNAAILASLYGCGLRRAELVALDLEHVENRATPAAAYRVLGKGNKTRIVYLPAGTAQALEAWLKYRGELPGPLFFATAHRGTRVKVGKRISKDTVGDVLGRLTELAGVDKLTPHDLRRAFASDSLDAGTDIATVMRMMGHAQITTTARYDRRREVAKLQASQRLVVPFEPSTPRR